MPKAARVLAALKRDDWIEVRRHGSHRTLKKGSTARSWTHHDGIDLGKSDLVDIARQFGYSLEALRKL